MKKNKINNIIFIAFIFVLFLILTSCKKKEYEVFFETKANGISNSITLSKLTLKEGEIVLDKVKAHIEENNQNNEIYNKENHYLAFAYYSLEDKAGNFISHGEMPHDYKIKQNMRLKFQFFGTNMITFLFSSIDYDDYRVAETVSHTKGSVTISDTAPYKKGYYFTNWIYKEGSIFSDGDLSGQDFNYNKTDYKDANGNNVNLVYLAPKWIKKNSKDLVTIKIERPFLTCPNGIKEDRKVQPNIIYNKDSVYYDQDTFYLEKGSKLPSINLGYDVRNREFSHYELPSGEKVTDETVFNENVTLTPIFTENQRITITFDTDGGNELPSVNLYAGESFLYYDILNIPIPVKAGYEFVLWQDSEGKLFNLTERHENSKTYSAIYKKENTFMVKFKNSDIAPIFVENGQSIDRPTDPSQKGNLIFSGWLDDQNNEVSFPLTITKDTTISANWLNFMDTFKYEMDFVNNGLIITGTKITDTYKELRIPEYYNNIKIIGIKGEGLTSLTNLERLVFSKSIKHIDKGVFDNTKFKTLNFTNDLWVINNVLIDIKITVENITEEDILNNNIYSVAKDVFKNKIHLKEIFIPSGLTIVYKEMFSNLLKLETLYLPETVTRIEEKAFRNCEKLRNLDLSNLSNLKYIGDYAFENSGIPSYLIDTFKLPNHKIEFGYLPFENTLFYESSIKNGYAVVNGTLLEITNTVVGKATIPDYVTVINSYVFRKDGNNTVTGIDILHKVEIDDYAFYKANAVEKVLIRPEVEVIGAFILDASERLMELKETKPSTTLITILQDKHNNFSENWNKFHKGESSIGVFRTHWKNHYDG